MKKYLLLIILPLKIAVILFFLYKNNENMKLKNFYDIYEVSLKETQINNAKYQEIFKKVLESNEKNVYKDLFLLRTAFLDKKQQYDIDIKNINNKHLREFLSYMIINKDLAGQNWNMYEQHKQQHPANITQDLIKILDLERDIINKNAIHVNKEDLPEFLQAKYQKLIFNYQK